MNHEKCVHCGGETRTKGVTLRTRIGELVVIDQSNIAPECVDCGAFTLGSVSAEKAALRAILVALDHPLTGPMLKSVRKQFGLKQAEFAKALETSPESISRWERKEREIPVYLKGQVKSLAYERLHPPESPGAFEVAS